MLTPRQESHRLPRTDVIYRIGSISLLWNRVDYELESLLRFFLAVTGDADTILSCLGTQDRAIVLNAFVHKNLPNDWSDYATHVLKGINICRKNRNLVAHGLSHKVTDNEIIIERFTKNLDSRKTYTIPADTLKQIEADLIVYSDALTPIMCQFALSQIHPKAKPIALPDKPPLPQNLEGTLREAPKSTPRPLGSSRA